MNDTPGLLFVSSIQLPEQNDATARKKWTGLADHFDVHVIGFSEEGFCRIDRFNCQFYGLPGNLWFPLRVAIYYLLVPWLAAYLSLRYPVRNWTAQGPYEAASVWMVKFLLTPVVKPRLIVEAHGDWIQSFIELRSLPLSSLVEGFLKLISPLLLFPADAFRSVSSTTHDLLEDYGDRDRPHLTFPGFTDLDVFLETDRAEKDERERSSILYVGALTELKGIDRLLEALEVVRHENSEISLKLCGSGQESKFLSETRKRDLTEAVEFLGTVPQTKLRDHYLKSRLVVLPSRTEGLPRVLLECLACWTPFVATKTPGSEQIQRDSRAGRTVPQNDTRALAEAMLDLFENETKRRELGNRGRQYVEANHSTDRFFESYVELVKAMNSSDQTRSDQTNP